MMRRFIFICLLLISVLYSAAQIYAQSIDERLKHLDSYLEKALHDWKTPGMAVGIVQGDSLIFAKGYGVREINKPEKVDSKTLFPIASISKTFTATSIAILVDSEKVNWDDLVINHLPWFELYDEYVTKHFKIRDMLSHRSGLKTFSGDLLWYGSEYKREEIVKRAKYLKPQYGFRERFGYSNIMFIGAGEIIQKVTEKSWDEYIKDNFFTKLGMVSTNTSINDLLEEQNIAIPHTEKEGETITIEYLDWDNMGPAGSINSNIEDMSKWISLHLHKGTYKGEKYFSKERSLEMWTQHTVNPVSESSSRIWPTTHFKSYGLGWSMFDYRGLKIVGHNGGYDGVLSSMQLIPEKNLGFIILTNKNSNLYYLTIYKILDVLLADDYENQTDWSDLFLSFEGNNDEETIKLRSAIELPPYPLEKYCGTYNSQLYGNATIENKEDILYIQLAPTPKFNAHLIYLGENKFEVEFKEFPSLPKGTVEFIFEGDKIKQMEIDVPNPDFDFTELEFYKN